MIVVIASGAKQSSARRQARFKEQPCSARCARLDCFVGFASSQ
jgi:hypothetical protein